VSVACPLATEYRTDLRNIFLDIKEILTMNSNRLLLTIGVVLFGLMKSELVSGQSSTVRGIVPEPGHEVKTVSQNWDHSEASWFYNTAQGSYLLRYEWFVNLEQADSEKLFRDSSHFQALGYLARAEGSDNPHGLASRVRARRQAVANRRSGKLSRHDLCRMSHRARQLRRQDLCHRRSPHERQLREAAAKSGGGH
jgi:hypothetical protein